MKASDTVFERCYTGNRQAKELHFSPVLCMYMSATWTSLDLGIDTRVPKRYRFRSWNRM